MTEKFQTFGEYDPAQAHDCEIAYVLLLRSFGTLAPSLRLIGGLVPRYLTPAKPPEVPAQAGTTDFDIVLNVAMLGEPGLYNKLRGQLKTNGFEPRSRGDGKVSSWQWWHEVNGHQVLVEFLQDTNDPEKSALLQPRASVRRQLIKPVGNNLYA